VTDPAYPSCLHKPNYIFFPYYIIYFLIVSYPPFPPLSLLYITQRNSTSKHYLPSYHFEAHPVVSIAFSCNHEQYKQAYSNNLECNVVTDKCVYELFNAVPESPFNTDLIKEAHRVAQKKRMHLLTPQFTIHFQKFGNNKRAHQNRDVI
jgi:hypothetical protein